VTSSTASTRPIPAPLVGDEAHVLALGLVGGAQVEVGRDAPHLGLGHRPERQEQPVEQLRAEHVEDVGLVLGGIRPPPETGAGGGGDDPGVMAGGHRGEPQGIGPAQQPVELEVTVALDAGVGCATHRMVGHVGPHHVVLEVVAEVEHVVLDPEPVGDPAGVVDVAHGAAPGVARATPQLHGDPDHLVALLAQQGGRHRRVDPARHHHHHPRRGGTGRNPGPGGAVGRHVTSVSSRP
jgi:hypothetical protein